ncbi:hypothetical protein GAP32_427 [Cronobacter phage vB_CsaM_GAP32]|uniref:Uncharacterized protein n=1 Tax=Cronobacter phage vB_CsaM_GAP32 TaxID=1141136 RepID=K4F9P7_9CAUD|nr:hypothetical protein GAP32_427 [Cronobacter phage vB_CsaM_GAP32]AFC21880.1 hypothetical protein GAP32_427 [Cronobacter phage vB_CsaM_GAP32]
MKSATELKNLHKRIQQLKSQQKLLNVEYAELDAKEKKTKDETKHLAAVRNLQWSLIYKIRGLELTFKDLKEQVILEIINS